ncbi:FkbM family methyltransferase [Flavimobilis sp. GY10621]|uniref:FkbM family methyltransferase n=1 Tax=Flavimobilis rhizosphaerae TaxID=2775421 RepID=A0ABR9DM06_9MICO|nr:FkbM family methyltransferase [Flavimobilis rhizosphaerae]MBD9698164.1 FkbM family methyltransferase [Flavimobilis rhizosphaerae]
MNHLGRTLHVSLLDSRGLQLVEAAGDLNPLSLRLWNLLVGRRDWDLVVDVGANYGEMLLGAAFPPGARAVAFEPLPEVNRLLRRSIAESGLDVEVAELAVSDFEGDVALMRDVSWSGKSSLKRASSATEVERVDVKATTLSAYFRDASVRSACVKIDVEGAEAEVLAGAREFVDSVDEIALMVEVLHMSNEEIAQLAQEWQVFAFDSRYGRLVRVLGTPRAVIAIVRSNWCYRQDVVLVPKGRPLPWRPQ